MGKKKYSYIVDLLAGIGFIFIGVVQYLNDKSFFSYIFMALGLFWIIIGILNFIGSRHEKSGV
jgi:hypothetical protein